MKTLCPKEVINKVYEQFPENDMSCDKVLSEP